MKEKLIKLISEGRSLIDLLDIDPLDKNSFFPVFDGTFSISFVCRSQDIEAKYKKWCNDAKTVISEYKDKMPAAINIFWMDDTQITFPHSVGLVFQQSYNNFFTILHNLRKKVTVLSEIAEELDKRGSKRAVICISRQRGIYWENCSGGYPLSGKRLNMLLDFKELGIQKGPELASKFYNDNLSVLNSTIKEINKHFKGKLDTSYDLICRVPTRGFQLNKEKFNFKFQD